MDDDFLEDLFEGGFKVVKNLAVIIWNSTIGAFCDRRESKKAVKMIMQRENERKEKENSDIDI